MLTILYDFIPVVLFFIAFKFYNIYVATVVGMVVTALQFLFSSIKHKKIHKPLLFTLIVFIIFGGMTLYLHNPLFIKWKPTILYWAFAIILFCSHFVGKKSIIHRLMDKSLEGKGMIPPIVLKRLSTAWIIFFVTLGIVNIYVAYMFSTEAWVNFKLYGALGALLVFSFLQAIYLSKHVVMSPESK